MSKKLPKFDNAESSRSRKGKKSKGADYYKNKYRKTFQQLLEEDKLTRPADESYSSAIAPPSQVTL